MRRPSLQLFGALLLVCLTLSPFSIPAFARALSPPSATTALSIPQEATPDAGETVRYGTISLAVPAAWPVYDLSTNLKRCARFRNVYSSACITNWAWGILTGGPGLKLTISTSGELTLCYSTNTG